MAGRGAASLPQVIPIFPLTGVLLLPRGRLPLNIFEPRYLAMVQDALKAERLVGMVQPSEPDLSNRAAGPINPPVYPTGCAGRITSFSEADDGRYLITLTGVSRFRIRDELPLMSGYRRVEAEWQPYAADLEEPVSEPEFDRQRFVQGLRGFLGQRQVTADWAAIEKAPAEQLITSIAMLGPFAPEEKQALLEAATLSERARLLTALVEMAALHPTEEPGTTRH